MQRAMNYIGGAWMEPDASERLPVLNPASAEALGEVPLSAPAVVDQAAQAVARAFPDWRRTPAVERVQHLFRLKDLLEQHFEELARSIALENGKTLDESRGELRRAIENVELACGIPSLMQGYNSEDIARGIDESMIRQPVGVEAILDHPAIRAISFVGSTAVARQVYACAAAAGKRAQAQRRSPPMPG